VLYNYVLLSVTRITICIYHKLW